MSYLTPTSPQHDPPQCPVDFYEEAGFPQSRWSNGQFEAVRKLRCAWADRRYLLEWIDTPPNNIYPYDDGPPDAVAFYVGMDGVGQQGSETYTPVPDDGRYPVLRATYLEASVTVKYTTEWFRNIGGVKVSEAFRPDAETHMRDHHVFKWSGDVLLTAGEAPYQTYYGLQYVVKYHNVIAVPAWVFARVGTCNANTVNAVVISGISFAPQRLLYQPPNIVASISTGNVRSYDVTCYYRYHPSGWNTFWRQSTQQYEPIYLLDGTQYIQYPPVAY